MGLFDRLEQRLERAVNGAFAKAFKSSVQPVEIASAMRRAMDDRAAATSRLHGKTASQATVPNMFTVELSTKDYDDLTVQADELTDELLASCEEHMESQRYKTAGPMRIVFAENTDLDTGVFTLRPASARRPFDITPDGLAERDVPSHHGYEEYEEMSIGMPVIRPDDEVPESRGARHRTKERGRHASAGTAAAAAGAAAASAAPAPVPSPAPPVPTAEPADHADAPYGDQPEPYREHRPDAGYRAEPDRYESYDRAEPQPAQYEHPEPDLYSRPAAEQAAPPARRPSVTRRPWLDIDGDRYPLLGAITVIGRDHASDIVLDDPGISRRHAELRVTTDGPHPVITLIDLGSTNGVFVNGERMRHTHVADGDRITLGRSSMTLRTGR